MRPKLAVLATLWVVAVGCSSGTLTGHDAGRSPIDAGAQPFFDGGPWPLDGGGSVQSLTLSTNDLVFDSTRGVIYATLNPTGDAGNSVVTIDPTSAKVTGALAVGGLPSVLAISDDGSALYVGVNTPAGPPALFPGVDGADSVRRIDLASMTPGPAVSLGSNAISKLTAGRIVAVPRSSTRYVVSLRQPGFTPDFAGLALYDGDTLISQLDAFYGSGDSIAFADPSTLFGCSDGEDPSELIEYNVTTAITPAPGAKVNGLLTGGLLTRIAFNGGWIFTNNGQTVSAKTFALVGTYNDSIIATFPNNAAAVPDPDGADVWFLRTTDSFSPGLLDFDRTTFQLRRTISLAPLTVDSDLANATALVQWSPTGFAFKTYSKVYVMTTAN